MIHMIFLYVWVGINLQRTKVANTMVIDSRGFTCPGFGTDIGIASFILAKPHQKILQITRIVKSVYERQWQGSFFSLRGSPCG